MSSYGKNLRESCQRYENGVYIYDGKNQRVHTGNSPRILSKVWINNCNVGLSYRECAMSRTSGRGSFSKIGGIFPKLL